MGNTSREEPNEESTQIPAKEPGVMFWMDDASKDNNLIQGVIQAQADRPTQGPRRARKSPKRDLSARSGRYVTALEGTRKVNKLCAGVAGYLPSNGKLSQSKESGK